MRHPPQVLFGVALVVSVLPKARGVCHEPGTVGEETGRAPGRDIAGGGIEQVLPILRPVLEDGGSCGIAQRISESGDGKVIDRPLQRDRGAGDTTVGAEFRRLWSIAEPQIGGDSRPLQETVKSDTALGRCIHHVVQRGFEVEIPGAEGVEVYDERYHTVSAHHAGCGIRQRPTRIRTTLLRVGHQRLDHVAGPLREQQSLQWGEAAVGVPVGEIGVVGVPTGNAVDDTRRIRCNVRPRR